MSEPLGELSRRDWDAVVIGAGPAGSVISTLLARRGLAVLLVDKASFPRPKVCGGCLNPAALAALEAARLGHLPWELGALPLSHLRLSTGSRSAMIPLRGGAGVSRQALDAALARAALDAGATFVDGTRARAALVVGHRRPVHLSRGTNQMTVLAHVVVLASGIGPLPAEDADHLPSKVASATRIGAGAQIADAPAQVPPGVIVMVSGNGGYVGLVRVEGGALNVGAAFDGGFVQRTGGLGEAAATLVQSTSAPLATLLRSLRWRGTPPLTFRRQGLARERLFVLGDAGGYVEPFTGEGMAWALTGAIALAPLAAAAATHWDEHLGRAWECEYARLVRLRQRLCHVVAAGLRRPTLTAAAVHLLRAIPQLAAPAVRAINLPPRRLARP